jgi:hypothetical protein
VNVCGQQMAAGLIGAVELWRVTIKVTRHARDVAQVDGTRAGIGVEQRNVAPPHALGVAGESRQVSGALLFLGRRSRREKVIAGR